MIGPMGKRMRALWNAASITAHHALAPRRQLIQALCPGVVWAHGQWANPADKPK